LAEGDGTFWDDFDNDMPSNDAFCG